MQEVRIGVLGCGIMGSDLLNNAVQLRGVKAAGLYDPIKAMREKLAAETGGYPITSEKAACEDCDAVIIAPPCHLHAKLATLAIKTGRHVFLEKPMALSVKDCDRLIKAAQRADVHLMVGHVLRYVPVYRTVKSLVDAGRVGDVLSIRTVRSFYSWSDWTRPWRLKKRQCGGLIFESQIHELDFMRHIAGDVRRVSAVASKSPGEEWDFHDSIFVNLEFHSGAVGNLFACLVDRVGFQGGEIIGTKGTIYFTCPDSIVLRTASGKQSKIDPTKKKIESCVRREVREFVKAVRGEGPVTLPGEEGREAVAIIEAAHASIASGQSVLPKRRRSRT
ncbi:MAG: Gfo/Idh/MocA family oxidoreductase [bacterium]